MTNIEKYNKIFIEVFQVNEDALNDDFNSNNIDGWDSVKQLSLTSSIEDEFSLLLDAEDILGFSSYSSGKSILKKYDIEL